MCPLHDEIKTCTECGGEGWLHNEDGELNGFCWSCKGSGFVKEPAYPNQCFGCNGCYKPADNDNDGEID